MPALTGIESPGYKSKKRVLLVDEEPWRVTSSDAMRDLDLCVGDVLDEHAVSLELDAAEPVAARARALRILDARDRSTGELTARLAEDGYPQTVVADVVTRLESAGLLDDARLGDALVSALSERKGYGRHRVKRELMRRRIPEDVAAQALTRLAPEDEEDERAMRCAERLASQARTRDKLVERLVRRGFGWETARRAVSHLDSAQWDSLS